MKKVDSDRQSETLEMGRATETVEGFFRNASFQSPKAEFHMLIQTDFKATYLVVYTPTWDSLSGEGVRIVKRAPSHSAINHPFIKLPSLRITLPSPYLTFIDASLGWRCSASESRTDVWHDLFSFSWKNVSFSIALLRTPTNKTSRWINAWPRARSQNSKVRNQSYNIYASIPHEGARVFTLSRCTYVLNCTVCFLFCLCCVNCVCVGKSNSYYIPLCSACFVFCFSFVFFVVEENLRKFWILELRPHVHT